MEIGNDISLYQNLKITWYFVVSNDFFNILVFIFAAPSHDCNEPILASNNDGNILSKDDGVEQITYKFNYDSLFPTIASEVSFFLFVRISS